MVLEVGSVGRQEVPRLEDLLAAAAVDGHDRPAIVEGRLVQSKIRRLIHRHELDQPDQLTDGALARRQVGQRAVGSSALEHLHLIGIKARSHERGTRFTSHDRIVKIAVPSLVAFSYFSKKIEVMSVEMETLVVELIGKCYFGRVKRDDVAISQRQVPAAPIVPAVRAPTPAA